MKQLAAAALVLMSMLACSNDSSAPPSNPGTEGAAQGHVYTMATTEPLADVTIQLAGQSTVSDSSGYYAVEHVTTGAHTLSADKTGYEHYEVPLTISAGLPLLHDVRLTPIVPAFDPYATWEVVASGSDQLHALVILDDLYLIAGGYGSNTFLVSSDGGASWGSRTHAGQDAFGKINAIAFFDAVHGLATYGYGKILKTSDAGETWALQSITDTEFFDLVCLSATTALLVGGEIWRTTDSGTTWNRIVLSIPNLYYYSSVSFPSSTTGFMAVIKEPGTQGPRWGILRTNNAGSSWTSVGSDQPGEVYQLQFTDEHTGYAIGDNVFSTTSDAGLTWHSMGDYGSGTWIHFVTPAIGFAFCSGSTGPGGSTESALLRTVDAGVTWGKVDYGSGVDLYGMRTRGSRGFLFGDDGTVLRSHPTL